MSAGPRLVLSALLIVLGCAPLTTSQLREVHSFGKAVDEYALLPGAVLTGFAEGRVEATKLSIETLRAVDADSAQAAYRTLAETYLWEERFRRQARQLDQTLAVLELYAEALVALSTEDFTSEVESQARALGAALDGSIAAYNQRDAEPEAAETRLPRFGPRVASGVRWLGGWYVRRQQARAVRDFVRRAEPVIDRLTKRIEHLLEPYAEVRGRAAASWPRQSLMAVEGAFRRRAVDEGKIAAKLVSRVERPTRKLIAAEALAGEAIAAAQALRKAHSELSSALAARRELAQHIDAIGLLAADVRAALEVMKKLEAREP